MRFSHFCRQLTWRDNAPRGGHDEAKETAFTPEFKADAVTLVQASGRNIAQTERDMDLTETVLGEWVRRDNKRLQMERDILKKATAFFAKEIE
jgi:transposase-like protein